MTDQVELGLWFANYWPFPAQFQMPLEKSMRVKLPQEFLTAFQEPHLKKVAGELWLFNEVKSLLIFEIRCVPGKRQLLNIKQSPFSHLCTWCDANFVLAKCIFSPYAFLLTQIFFHLCSKHTKYIPCLSGRRKKKSCLIYQSAFIISLRPYYGEIQNF